MQQSVHCNHCGQVVLMESGSPAGLACPGCQAPLPAPGQHSVQGQQTVQGQQAGGPLAKNLSAPLPYVSPIAPSPNSTRPPGNQQPAPMTDPVAAQNEIANRNLFAGLLIAAGVVILLVGLGLYLLVSMVSKQNQPQVARENPPKQDTDPSPRKQLPPLPKTWQPERDRDGTGEPASRVDRNQVVEKTGATDLPRKSRPESSQPTSLPAKPLPKSLDERISSRIEGLTWGVKGMRGLRRGDRQFLVFGLNRGLQVYDWNALKKTDAKQLDNGKLLQVSHDGQSIFCTGRDGSITVFSVSDSGVLAARGKFEGHPSEVKVLCVANDNRTVISGSREKNVRMWSLDTFQEIANITGFSRYPVQCAIRKSDQSTLVFDGQTIYQLDLSSGKIGTQFKVGYGEDGCFSKDGTLFAQRTGTEDMTIFSTEKMQPIAKFESPSFPRHLRFSPDNRQLYWGTHGWAHVYHLASGQQEKFRVHPTFGLEEIAFFPKGQQCAIATGSSGGEIVFLTQPQFPGTKK